MYMGVSDWDIDAMVYSAAVCLVGVVSMPLAWRCSAPSMESTSRNVAAVGCSMHGAWSMVGMCAALNARVRVCDDALVAGTQFGTLVRRVTACAGLRQHLHSSFTLTEKQAKSKINYP